MQRNNEKILFFPVPFHFSLCKYLVIKCSTKFCEEKNISEIQLKFFRRCVQFSFRKSIWIRLKIDKIFFFFVCYIIFLQLQKIVKKYFFFLNPSPSKVEMQNENNSKFNAFVKKS